MSDAAVTQAPLLAIERLAVHFPLGGGIGALKREVVHAVDGVSFDLAEGEAVALVGESGCGKTTVARAVMGLAPVTSGSIRLRGEEIAGGGNTRSAAFRREAQMVFQDPFDSLNPRKTVRQTLAQPLAIHDIVPAARREAEIVALLERVGLTPGAAYLDRYPHQFSGGQRQRICIARAIAVRPGLIVADEAVSALDISIRAQILALLTRLKRELALTLLFISHDLGVVRSLCDRVLVMYLGRVVESGSTEEVFAAPRHPYTRALLAASPLPDPQKARARPRTLLEGELPSPVDPPAGCRFHTRCPHAQALCRDEPPPRRFGATQIAHCHFAGELAPALPD